MPGQKEIHEYYFNNHEGGGTQHQVEKIRFLRDLLARIVTGGTQVVMLGSGTPNAEADRVSSGLAIAVDGRPYLVDCGHGIVQRVVQARAGRTDRLGPPPILDRLFITHLHADHTVGIPDLLFTPWIHGREAPLQAYGPVGLKHMLAHIQLAYAENIREHRSAHPVHAKTWLPGARA